MEFKFSLKINGKGWNLEQKPWKVLEFGKKTILDKSFNILETFSEKNLAYD